MEYKKWKSHSMCLTADWEREEEERNAKQDEQEQGGSPLNPSMWEAVGLCPIQWGSAHLHKGKTTADKREKKEKETN